MLNKSLLFSLSVLLICPSSAFAKRGRVPLTQRMNNPCAVSWSYSTSPSRRTEAVTIFAEQYGIPVAKGDRDIKGNYVAKFATRMDGARACHIILREMYSNLDLMSAMQTFSGHQSGDDYARYIHNRTGIPLTGKKLGQLNKQEWRDFEQAQNEWESGQPKTGLIHPPPTKKRKR